MPPSARRLAFERLESRNLFAADSGAEFGADAWDPGVEDVAWSDESWVDDGSWSDDAWSGDVWTDDGAWDDGWWSDDTSWSDTTGDGAGWGDEVLVGYDDGSPADVVENVGAADAAPDAATGTVEIVAPPAAEEFVAASHDTPTPSFEEVIAAVANDPTFADHGAAEDGTAPGAEGTDAGLLTSDDHAEIWITADGPAWEQGFESGSDGEAVDAGSDDASWWFDAGDDTDVVFEAGFSADAVTDADPLGGTEIPADAEAVDDAWQGGGDELIDQSFLTDDPDLGDEPIFTDEVDLGEWGGDEEAWYTGVEDVVPARGATTTAIVTASGPGMGRLPVGQPAANVSMGTPFAGLGAFFFPAWGRSDSGAGDGWNDIQPGTGRQRLRLPFRLFA